MSCVSQWTGVGEPTLADVEREFRGWEAWRDASGLCFARQVGRPQGQPVQVKGEDPRDLRDSIIRWMGLNEEEGAQER